MTRATRQLHDLGQSLWLDNISRRMLRTGELKRLVDEDAVTGITSNPTIFEKAMSRGDDYDEDIATLARELAELEVDFIEQPFPPDRNADIHAVALPVMADESCVTEENVPVACSHFDGFNIKLVKCGGITPARGHAGDSRGSDQLGQALDKSGGPTSSTAVFGCPLNELNP